jgi:hypothetical protein
MDEREEGMAEKRAEYWKVASFMCQRRRLYLYLNTTIGGSIPPASFRPKCFT